MIINKNTVLIKQCVRRGPDLDLPNQLLIQIQQAVHSGTIVPSFFHQSRNTGKTLWERILFRYYFGQHGMFRVYRLEKDLEKSIQDHYKNFITRHTNTPKIRLKATHNVRSLIPHSDAADGGDTVTLTIGVLTNNEITSWYNQGASFRFNFWSLLKLKKICSVNLQPGEAYIFNNSTVHGVNKCDPTKTRMVLTISLGNDTDKLKYLLEDDV